MKTKEFRAVMADVHRDLDEIKSVIEGSRSLREHPEFAKTVAIYRSLVDYGDKIVLKYIDPDTGPLMAGKKRRQWPGPDQSPASIWADMRFIIDQYWEHVEAHDEIDPANSSEIITSRFLHFVSITSQKLTMAKLILKERDPGYLTQDMGQVLDRVVRHAAKVLGGSA